MIFEDESGHLKELLLIFFEQTSSEMTYIPFNISAVQRHLWWSKEASFNSFFSSVHEPDGSLSHRPNSCC